VATEWDAETYREVSALQEWLAAKSLASLTLNGGERVLDVGCGDGRISAAIAAHLPSGSVLGVDASQHMVDFAAAAFPPAEHSNLRFAVADAAALHLGPEFDLAVSFNALHWVLDLPAALRGLHAALAPGGRALLRFVPAGTRRSLEDVTRIPPPRRSGGRGSPIIARLVHPDAARPRGARPRRRRLPRQGRRHGSRSRTRARARPSPTSPREPSSPGRAAPEDRGTRSSTTCSIATRPSCRRRPNRTRSSSTSWRSS
jgi:SAM-dependent methyltransferase